MTKQIKMREGGKNRKAHSKKMYMIEALKGVLSETPKYIPLAALPNCPNS